MLQDATKNGFEHIVSWLPCGTAFKVFDQDLFEEFIIPGYFTMSKYKSFIRQLNFYQFRMFQPGKRENLLLAPSLLLVKAHYLITISPPYKTSGSYYHDYFTRDRLHDCQLVQRRKVNRKEDPPAEFATQHNQLSSTRAKKSPTPHGSRLRSANDSGRPQVDTLCEDVIVDDLGYESLGAAETLSVAQSKHSPLGGDVTQKKPHAIGMKIGQSICPRGQVLPTFKAGAGDNSWFRDHDALLLEYAYHTVGVPLTERKNFSENEIKDELKTTFSSNLKLKKDEKS
jgi:hypothetical protein